MSVLLDTNIVSELRKGERMDPLVRRWFEGLADEDVHMSVLVVGEIRRGIERIRIRDRRQAFALERWLQRLVRDYASRLLPIDRPVAEEWGRLSSRRTGSPIDLLMAATARVHELVLVTRNVSDIDWTGVSYFNPFERPRT